MSKVYKISFGAIKTKNVESKKSTERNEFINTVSKPDTFEKTNTSRHTGFFKSAIMAAAMTLGIAASPLNTNAQQYKVITTSDWIVGKTTSDKSVYGLAKRFNMTPEKFSETFDVPLDGVKRGYVFKVPSHKVDNGETLSSIAKMYKMDVKLLAQINDIDMEKDAALKPGEYIFILPNTKPQKKTAKKSTVSTVSADNANKIIYTSTGKKWTVQSLHEHVQNTALENGRPANRPLPAVNKNSRISAEVKIYQPAGNGKLSDKTIIINTGHGYNANGEFDAGKSNAVLAKNNSGKIVETTNFIGNRGKALEEWKINRELSIDLAEELVKQGAKVVFISGGENLAEKEIRNTKADMLISLHSNSDENDKGIQILYNIRGSLDKKDKQLADVLQSNFESNSRLRGINEQKGRSLDALSASKLKTLAIPAVMIETGNLQNEDDIHRLNAGYFKKALVQQIGKGIVEYFEKY